MIAIAALVLMLLSMLVELQISRRHEQALRLGGAIQPPDPVYKMMRVAYPGLFVCMAAEGALRHLHELGVKRSERKRCRD